MDAWVEVILADGTSERHFVEEDQVTVGRSPVAGIPLVTADELQPEHLLLAPRPDGCWVAIADGAEPGVLIEGHPFTHGVVPWNTELQVGSLRLRVTDRPPAEQSERAVSLPILALVLLLVPLAAWLWLAPSTGGLNLDPGAPPPELFGAAPECPDHGSAALHEARDSAEAASSKAERYPFDAQDGIEAVGLYQQAEACYRTVGRDEDAVRLGRSHEALARQIEEDYRTHRLRLERALEQGRYGDALLEAKGLAALIDHTDGQYTRWLRILERQLQLMVDKQLAKK